MLKQVVQAVDVGEVLEPLSVHLSCPLTAFQLLFLLFGLHLTLLHESPGRFLLACLVKVLVRVLHRAIEEGEEDLDAEVLVVDVVALGLDAVLEEMLLQRSRMKVYSSLRAKNST